MRLFFKATKSDEERSRELSNKLKNLNPKTNEKEIMEVSAKILERHKELETSILLRDRDGSKAYNLRCELERLYGKKSDLEQQPWRERNLIITELTELNGPAIEHALEWLSRAIKELEDLKKIEEVSRKQDAGSLLIRFTVKTNFSKIQKAQALLQDAKKAIRNMAASSCISEIEAVYISAIEKVPGGEVVCDEEAVLDEQTYFEMKDNLSSGMVKSDADILVTYQRYGIYR